MKPKKIEGFNGEYRFLSNFYPSKVIFDGMEYPSTECAYQAAKTLDQTIRTSLQTATPGQAKKIGKKIQLRDDWNEVKLGIMENLVRQKFLDEDLRKKLLETGESYLEETNWWNDVFWGVCKGKGENHLGKILMKVREEIAI